MCACVCVCICSVCSSSQTLQTQWHCECAFPEGSQPRELWTKKTPLPLISILLSKPLSRLPSSLYPLSCSLSAGGEIQMWRGRNWTGKGAGEGRRGDRLHCPRPFRHIHTNNYVHQTMESLLTTGHYCRVYACVCICVLVATKQINEKHLWGDLVLIFNWLTYKDSWPGVRLLFSFS